MIISKEIRIPIFSNIKLNTKWCLLIVVFYFLISLYGIVNHEIWLDEAHHYLLGRDSNSFLDLFNNTRYDGHPILWNYFMHIITRFSFNPFYMQLLHIVISALLAFIILKYTPFKLWVKLALLLSYFSLYEYNLISRNYSLGVLFLFLACVNYPKKNNNAILFSMFLALSCNTHSIFSIPACALIFSFFTKQFFIKPTQLFKYYKSAFIFIVGVIIACIQIIPNQDTVFFKSVDFASFYKLFKTGTSLFKALVPVVDFTSIKFWNHNYFIEHYRFGVVLISVIFWVFPFLLFRGSKFILLFVYSTCIGFIIFKFLIHVEGFRYYGVLFYTLILGLWLQHKTTPNFKMNKWNRKLVLSLLVVQVFSGILAFYLEVKYPFDNGKFVVDYINSKKIPLNQIVTNCESASINTFNKSNFHNLCYNKPQGFYLWNQVCDRIFSLDGENLIQEVIIQKPNEKNLYLINNKKIVYDSNYNKKKLPFTVTLEKAFEKSVVKGYYIYKITQHE